VITREEIQAPIQKFLASFRVKIRVELVALNGFMGTADALRQTADRISSDFFVLSGDIITNVHLQHLADIHRTRGAMLTALLHAPKPDPQAAGKKKKREEDDVRKQFIGLERRTNRLVYFKSASDVEDVVQIDKAVLHQVPNLIIHSALLDAHLYLFSHRVLKLLAESKHISSVQGELIPYLVQAQFAAQDKIQWAEGEDDAKAMLWSHSPDSDVGGLKCFAFLPPENSYIARANTVSSYVQMNRDLASGMEFEYRPWASTAEINKRAEVLAQNSRATMCNASVVGSGCRVADCTIKKSNIGAGCVLGEGVKISNSVVMDRVVLEDGCKLENCIISEGAIIKKKAVLSNCLVSANFIVAQGDYKNESFFGEQH